MILNTLTGNFQVDITTSEYQARHVYTDISQYRSRLKVSDEIIFSAFAHRFINNEANYHLFVNTFSVPLTEEETDEQINIITSQSQAETAREIKYVCTARTSEFIEKYRAAVTDWDKVEDLITAPNVSLEVYTKENRMIVLASTMSANIWWQLGTLWCESKELKAAWKTGNAITIKQAIEQMRLSANEEELKSTLDNLEELTRKIQSNNEENKYIAAVRKARSRIADLQRMIDDELLNIREYEAKYLVYLQTASETRIEALQNILRRAYNRRTISKIQIEDEILYLQINATVGYWDTHSFELIKNATRSNWYTQMVDWKKELVDKLVHNEIKLNLKQEVAIQFDRGLCSYSNSVPGAMPNPHHAEYNCWGDNKGKISEAMLNFNWEEMIAYIASAVSALNILDVPVMHRFAEYLDRYGDAYCLEANGEMKTPNQFKREYILAREGE